MAKKAASNDEKSLDASPAEPMYSTHSTDSNGGNYTPVMEPQGGYDPAPLPLLALTNDDLPVIPLVTTQDESSYEKSFDHGHDHSFDRTNT